VTPHGLFAILGVLEVKNKMFIVPPYGVIRINVRVKKILKKAAP
jgi:hypothetical protein